MLVKSKENHKGPRRTVYFKKYHEVFSWLSYLGISLSVLNLSLIFHLIFLFIYTYFWVTYFPIKFGLPWRIIIQKCYLALCRLEVWLLGIIKWIKHWLYPIYLLGQLRKSNTWQNNYSSTEHMPCRHSTCRHPRLGKPVKKREGERLIDSLSPWGRQGNFTEEVTLYLVIKNEWTLSGKWQHQVFPGREKDLNRVE